MGSFMSQFDVIDTSIGIPITGKMYSQFCHPSNACLEVKTSIKTPVIYGTVSISCSGQRNGEEAWKLPGLHFYQSSGEKKKKKKLRQRLHHTVPEPSAFGRSLNTAVLASVDMETQVHSRRTAQIRRRNELPGSIQNSDVSSREQEKSNGNKEKTNNERTEHSSLTKLNWALYKVIREKLNPQWGSH